MRVLAHIIFIISGFLSPFSVGAAQLLSPCVTDAEARELVRRNEASLFDQSRRLNPNLTIWHFSRYVESIQWDWIRGEFVSADLGQFSCTPNRMCVQRISVSCRRDGSPGSALLSPEIAVEAVH